MAPIRSAPTKVARHSAFSTTAILTDCTSRGTSAESALATIVPSEEEEEEEDDNSFEDFAYLPLPKKPKSRPNIVSKAKAAVARSNKSAIFAPITINGQRLQPTVAFDALWEWAQERMVIDSKRRSGLPPPWTEDYILRDYFFCNPFRVADRVTQYLITEVIEKGPQTPNELVFRVCLFSIFTKPETWESLNDAIGPILWSKYNRSAYRAALEAIVDSGRTLYTGAYQKPAPKFDSEGTFMNHLALVEMWMDLEFPQRLKRAEYLANVYEWIISFPGMGEFNTYQLLLNLTYTSVAHFSNNDFVVAGIGAKSGLCKLFGNSYKIARENVETIDEDIMRWMVDNQSYCFLRLGIDFIGLGPKHLPLELPDIEHTICEIDKYARLAFPHIKGRDSRTNLRRTYAPSGRVPRPLHLPKAWSHPARKILRVRPSPPVIEKRYVIQAIAGQRQGTFGLEYHVFWYGYPEHMATWEPEDGIILDAPDVVADYRKHGKGERREYIPAFKA